MDKIILDTSPLARLCHPRGKSPLNPEVGRWFADHMAAGPGLILPEIADYEVRRELIRIGRSRGLAHLDRLKSTLTYLPLDTPTMVRAAELWAQARNSGTPTAPPEALDADVILAAQAERTGAIVATENVGHVSLFVSAKHWRDLRPTDDE